MFRFAPTGGIEGQLESMRPPPPHLLSGKHFEFHVTAHLATLIEIGRLFASLGPRLC